MLKAKVQMILDPIKGECVQPRSNGEYSVVTISLRTPASYLAGNHLKSQTTDYPGWFLIVFLNPARQVLG